MTDTHPHDVIAEELLHFSPEKIASIRPASSTTNRLDSLEYETTQQIEKAKNIENRKIRRAIWFCGKK